MQPVTNAAVTLHAEGLFREAPSTTDSQDPVLLLSEAEAPSSRWPGELLVGIAQRSPGAIWFDTRDCGRSSWATEPYSLSDLVDDAVAVLDSFDVERAHVFGRSMGGQVAQRLAVAHPDRVSALTLLSTTPGQPERFGLPAQWLIDKMSERLFADAPADTEGRAAWITEQQEWFSGPVFGFDREALLAAYREEVDTMWRGPNLHGHAVVEASETIADLGSIRAPTLILHGTADPVHPIEHGRALAELIAGARLNLVEGLGHELPPTFVPELLRLMFAT